MRLLLITALLFLTTFCDEAKPSFSIDWEGDRFVKDGETFQYASAGMHYFRIPHQYWAHRISAAKSAGLNAVTTYVAWNEHEHTPGSYKFTGQQDLLGFISECGKQGMPVILRVGPYICGEWDYGGIPAWVMNVPGMAIRSNNAPWLKVVQSWLNVLLPIIIPHLYNNGGNILMVQVENEYGSWGCDHDYMSKLQGLFMEHLGDETVLFTTDGAGDHMVKCGSLDTLFTTVDFGAGGDPKGPFNMLRKHQPHGPAVNTELYTGWLDHWGKKHQTRNAAPLGKTIDDILSLNASVSLYMWHGGTNFGLTSGGQSVGENKAPVPTDSKKWDGGVVKLAHAARLVNLFEVPDYDLGLFPYPRSMESLSVYSGVIAYVHNTKQQITGSLVLTGIRDRAYVMVDGVYVKVAKSGVPVANNTFTVSVSKSLIIFVENMGHTNYGGVMKQNFKGLLSNVTLDGPIVGWQHYWVPVVAAHRMKLFDQDTTGLEETDQGADYLSNLSDTDYPFLFNMKPLMPGGPTMFYTMFQGNPDNLDTFLDITGWSKGFATLNNFDLGRYWPDAGPQYTLYVPGVYFMTSYNILTLTEMQSSFKDLTVTFRAVPTLDGPFDPSA